MSEPKAVVCLVELGMRAYIEAVLENCAGTFEACCVIENRCRKAGYR